MDRSRLLALTPRPTDRAPCGSKSTSRTRRPYSAIEAPRLIVDVVLPTPPFWLHMAMTLAGPCLLSWGGSGNLGMGRPVGPIYPWPSPDSTRPSAASESSSRGGGTSWISGRLFAAVDLATVVRPPCPPIQ